MATNKHATIRYHALDRCFSNYGRKFFIEDLLQACNEAIYNFAGIEDGIKRRQIFDDISFMESEEGWSIPLERVRDGKRVYYRYSDKNFSIKNQGINQEEAEQLKETLTILSRFKGLPQFEWVEEIQIRLQDTFMLKSNINAAVGFESNPYLKGLNFFTDLFNAIQNRQVLEIDYQGYRQDAETKMTISPWYLKQYNNRWFLFGFNKEYESLSNLAIDRILSIKDLNEPFVPNETINFEEYFDDVIGVSVMDDAPVETVVMRITNEAWPYIKSKPIHGSQKIRTQNPNYVEIELRVQINYELISTLFSYLDAIEITEPMQLRERFRIISENINNKNT